MRYPLLAVFLFASSAYASPGLQEAPEGNYDLVAVELVHIPEEVVVGDGVVFVTASGQPRHRRHSRRAPIGSICTLTASASATITDTWGLKPGRRSFSSMSEGYYHFKPTEPGTYTYRWVLDKEDNLPETDETNNIIEGTIVVAKRSAEHDRLQAALLDQLELIGKNMVEGRYPPELELGPDSTHKELQWFTELFDDIRD